MRKLWLVLLCLALGLSGCRALPAAARPLPLWEWTVAVDPGHGGMDNGCVGTTGVTEARLNLLVARALARSLVMQGARVVMTRTGDGVDYSAGTGNTRKQQDMSARLELIARHEADLVVSIHMNRYEDSGVRGAQCFFSPEKSGSRELALALQSRLNGLAEQVKPRSAAPASYYILRGPGCPCALVECGFLSNPGEEALLCREDYRLRLAEALCLGVLDYCRGTAPREP